MASSFSDSLLLSNISLRSSFLKGGGEDDTVTKPLSQETELAPLRGQFGVLKCDSGTLGKLRVTTSVSVSQITVPMTGRFGSVTTIKRHADNAKNEETRSRTATAKTARHSHDTADSIANAITGHHTCCSFQRANTERSCPDGTHGTGMQPVQMAGSLGTDSIKPC